MGNDLVPDLRAKTVDNTTILNKVAELQRVAYKKGWDEKSTRASNGIVTKTAPSIGEMGELNAMWNDIYSAFTAFLTPDPLTMFADGKLCDKATKHVGPGALPQSRLIGLQHTLPDGFKGKAADTFFRDYIDVHPAIVTNQHDAIDAVGAAITLNGMIYHSARATIMDVADKTIQQLNQESDSLKIALTVAGTIAAVVSSVGTGGAAAAAIAGGTATAATGFGVAGSIMGTLANAGNAVSSIGKEIKGAMVPDIIESMKSALHAVRQEMDNEQQKLIDGIGQARVVLHDMWLGKVPSAVSGRYATPDPHGNVGGRPVNLLVVNSPAGV
ncbi:MAG TPA: hypothetical protein VE172_05050 [Stackebrandtia sp.]|jgi:hypothetical protein|uniref:hypothetical protein n=1 Tax=Stackebrandtia sp. TaxID=2023065 RepID=UPI002D37CB75|nr:hypothetical protein [Stackebrandtia sp.]HZE38162.1 hypothetical protein [Stackebrandtia sp.]